MLLGMPVFILDCWVWAPALFLILVSSKACRRSALLFRSLGPCHLYERPGLSSWLWFQSMKILQKVCVKMESDDKFILAQKCFEMSALFHNTPFPWAFWRSLAPMQGHNATALCSILFWKNTFVKILTIQRRVHQLNTSGSEDLP